MSRAPERRESQAAGSRLEPGDSLMHVWGVGALAALWALVGGVRWGVVSAAVQRVSRRSAGSIISWIPLPLTSWGPCWERGQCCLWPRGYLSSEKGGQHSKEADPHCQLDCHPGSQDGEANDKVCPQLKNSHLSFLFLQRGIPASSFAWLNYLSLLSFGGVFTFPRSTIWLLFRNIKTGQRKRYGSAHFHK